MGSGKSRIKPGKSKKSNVHKTQIARQSPSRERGLSCEKYPDVRAKKIKGGEGKRILGIHPKKISFSTEKPEGKP